MSSFFTNITAVSVVVLAAGCATIPSVPDDHQFPVGEILRFTACELRDAYREMARDYPFFKAGEYGISVQLQPKSDTEFTAKAGLTGKNSKVKPFFISWAVGAATGGAAPGAGVDTTGHQDGAVYYTIKSALLIRGDPKHPLDCEHWSPAQHALVTNLGIREWLERSSWPTNHPIGQFAVDKHSFLAEITIQWDAGGAFTYNFPLGTDFATASARYKLDEILSITIAHEDPKPVLTGVVTLPSGGKFGTKVSVVGTPVTTISPDTKTRLDLLQLQQSIQNLQVTPRQ
jgi:hypothetical protein